MEASVDTNVFVALLDGGGEQAAWARGALDAVSSGAEIVVSPAVFAELVAGERAPEFAPVSLREKASRSTGISARTCGMKPDSATRRTPQTEDGRPGARTLDEYSSTSSSARTLCRLAAEAS